MNDSVKFLPLGRRLRNSRVADRLRHWLKEGSSPEKLALSIALGVAIGTFPLFGVPTLLCGVAAAALRLNFPVLQLVNSLMYPLQIALLWPFARLGGQLFGGGSFTDGWANMTSLMTLALHTTAAWFCFAIPAALIIYHAAHRLLIRYRARTA